MSLIPGKQLRDDTVTADKVDETGTLSTINAGDGAVNGVASGVARKDHQHEVSTAAPAASTVSAGAPAEGVASTLMRSDASIQADVTGTLAALSVGSAGSDGTGNGLALKTHEHAIPIGSPVELSDSTPADGATGNFADAGHVHPHGDRGGGSLHSLATTGVAGFMSAVDKVKLDSLQDAAGIDAKESVRARAQGNIGTLSGLLTVDGVTLVDGDRVLVDQQTTSSEDGIYIASTGAWSRAADLPTGEEARGSQLHVEEGTVDGNKLFACTNNAGSDVVGTDDLVFAQIGSGSPRGAGAGCVLNGNDIDVGANGDGSITVNADDIQVGVLATDAQHGARGGGTQHADATTSVSGFMSGADKTKLDGITAGAEPNLTENQEEITTQVITGTDTALTDTLTNAPATSQSLKLYLNGILQEQGATEDYTFSGTTITWRAGTGTAVDLDTNDTLIAVYQS